MEQQKIILPNLKCLRCGHNWTPRQEIVGVCPKCKSAYWDKTEAELIKADVKTIKNEQIPQKTPSLEPQGRVKRRKRGKDGK